MATESIDKPRSLIYQEHFTKQKSEFNLSEIVEQMEQAQDKIIRSHYYGSYLISGPAGSGKTTLALHRVAYLLQSPETAKLITTQKTIVFVQDKNTQGYFSKLLPDLGINNVRVTTFDEWAFELLNLSGVKFQQMYIEDEAIRDSYEYNKSRALKNISGFRFEKDIFGLLYYMYRDYLSSSELDLFLRQSKEHIVDRFDLTALLKAKKQETGVLTSKAPSYRRMNNGKYKRIFTEEPLMYSLIVVDEAENYLKENIELIKSCINPATKSVIYVGDLIQQTLPHTIKSWNEVQEEFNDERKVVLQKVYRNTKQILEYIRRCGYQVEISNELREGNVVQEISCSGRNEEMEMIKTLISKDQMVVGIIAKHTSYLDQYRKEFNASKNVHIMTINEAQGVEFDRVFLVGINSEQWRNRNMQKELACERDKVNRDLLYVALTRAMNELYIFNS
ncbi:ATP-binding domain-containing protein [Candidatus Roizmanbacteria bacterium]|nr:ATP-binding domain-containing protein [Candidatus Roizmanbacteria bacterium]